MLLVASDLRRSLPFRVRHAVPVTANCFKLSQLSKDSIVANSSDTAARPTSSHRLYISGIYLLLISSCF